MTTTDRPVFREYTRTGVCRGGAHDRCAGWHTAQEPYSPCECSCHNLSNASGEFDTKALRRAMEQNEKLVDAVLVMADEGQWLREDTPLGRRRVACPICGSRTHLPSCSWLIALKDLPKDT